MKVILNYISMKRILFTFAMIVFITVTLKADPPRKVTLSYNADTQKLKIEVSHPVQNEQKHFVESVTVSVNGKEVKVINLKSQTDKKGLVSEQAIPEIVKGSEVTVKAKCNMMGTKSASLKI